ncbi:hypothetical protein NKJ55_34260 [Mesorhizobium sp. M0106]|uniref:hypothetical protein n=1 Tax=Mesorhizobium sp. M0106 TaxID=2956880 RepID=UPI003335CA38
MSSTSATARTAFIDTNLITGARIVDNPVSALSVAPDGIGPVDGLNHYQKGLLYELNRFPGSTIFAYVPEGAAREEAIAHVEARGLAFEAANPPNYGRCLPGYLTIATYVGNLRSLFLLSDIQDGRSVTAIALDLKKLEDDGAAIAYALDDLQPFEGLEFLKDRRAGKDITAWVQHVHDVRQDAADMAP